MSLWERFVRRMKVRRMLILDATPETLTEPERPWVPGEPWSEHAVVEEPETPPVVPEPEVQEPVCGAEGTEEGQYTTCILAPDHRYKNGNPSPHKGSVKVFRTWPNDS